MPNDEDIWEVYAKSVKPIGKIKKGAVSKPQRRVEKTSSKQEHTSRTTIKQTNSPSALFDRRAERRLRQGDIEIDARIDLHGMRQNEAHEALIDFVGRQIKAGYRTLLVITGKGRNGPGILRSSLAGWLSASPFSTYILAIRPAAIRHGGEGAFYVLLKRSRLTK